MAKAKRMPEVTRTVEKLVPQMVTEVVSEPMIVLELTEYEADVLQALLGPTEADPSGQIQRTGVLVGMFTEIHSALGRNHYRYPIDTSNYPYLKDAK